MTTSNPLQDQLNAVAGQAAQVAQAAPVEQAAPVQQAQPMNTAQAVAQAYAPALVAAAPLSMDSADVASVGSVTEFIKLGDGGLKLGDGKFGATKFKLTIEGAENGGSYRPCHCMNYQGAAGYVYTKSYDGFTTVSANPSHNGLPWQQNCANILQISPKAYSYVGFELVLELLEDIVSTDKKTEFSAGTLFGYTTPYTASKTVKAIWDKAIKEGKRGETLIVEVSGEEVSNNGNEFKKLIMNVVG